MLNEKSQFQKATCYVIPFYNKLYREMENKLVEGRVRNGVVAGGLV